jgi:hypothetical protein
MSERPEETTISIHYTLSAMMPAYARACIMDAYSRLINAISIADPLCAPTARTAVRTMPIMKTWDRGHVLQQIEEATGQALSAGDSLPDSLIAAAQALGLAPHELGMWIYESGHTYRTSQLAAWARRNGFGTAEAASA